MIYRLIWRLPTVEIKTRTGAVESTLVSTNHTEPIVNGFEQTYHSPLFSLIKTHLLLVNIPHIVALNVISCVQMTKINCHNLNPVNMNEIKPNNLVNKKLNKFNQPN